MESTPPLVARKDRSRLSNAKRCRRVGVWVDSVLRDPEVAAFFERHRTHYRGMWAEYERALAAYRSECTAIALRVLRSGTIREPLEHELLTQDPHTVWLDSHDTSVEVAGWFPRELASAFKDSDALDLEDGGGSVLRRPRLDDPRLPAAAAAILEDPALRDRGRRLHEAGTHFFGRLYVECRLPRRPRPPNTMESMRSRLPEDRLAYACARLLAVRDDATSIPWATEAERVWSEERGFQIDMLHHGLRSKAKIRGETVWARDAADLEELKRLVMGGLARAGLLRPVDSPAAPRIRLELSPRQEEVWESLAGKVLSAKDLRKTTGIPTAEAVRVVIEKIRGKLGKEVILRIRGAGYYRPDAPPDLEKAGS